MNLAKFMAKEFSKDQSTKVGAVIVGINNEVIAMGYNGFPRGIDDDIPERHLRPEKYDWSEHAERNAIYNAARIGVSLRDSRIYICALSPCNECARAIIQSGIKQVYVEDHEAQLMQNNTPEAQDRFARWKASTEKASRMLREAGVEVFIIPHTVE